MEDVHLILMFISLVTIPGCFTQYSAPRCPKIGGYVYIEHAYPCYFYACYNGKLVDPNPYKCPSDPEYYQLLEDSGVDNACSSCAKVYKKKGSSSEEDTTITTPTTQTTQPPPESTTTMATTTVQDTTTMTTDAPDSMLKEIHTVLTNSHVLRGRWVPSVGSLRRCLQACEEDEECLGFDFNPTDSSCWLHDMMTICTPVLEKDECIHFSLYNQCPATAPATGSPTNQMTTPRMDPTTPEYTRAFKGYHLVNGTVIPLAMEMATAENCVAICRLDAECVGADFDSSSNSCWLHGMETECGELQAKQECTHYRLREGICAPASSSPDTTPEPGAGETTTLPATNGNGGNNGGSNVRVDPEQVTDGFVESVQGYHVPGGVRMYIGVTLRQCLDSCLVTPYCLALDYDETDMTCYFHFRDSYCNLPQELYGVKHYKRLPCIADVANDVSATWYRSHAERGELLCTGCTLSFCMKVCLGNSSCAGLDFDIRDLGCYLFKPETVCGPLIPKDYCVHISRDVCVPDALSNLPIQNLALINYPAPSALPSGWQAYPGVRVRHGIQLGGSHLEPDQCIELCNTEASCLSGDYDTSDGTCWLHLTPETQCGQVEVSDTVYHFKRNRCDSVFGVLEPYISAIWTAP